MSEITYGKIARQIEESRKIVSDLHLYKVEVGSSTDFARDRVKNIIDCLESLPITTWSSKVRSKYYDLVRFTNYIGTVMWNQEHGNGNGDIHKEKHFGRLI